MNTLHGIRHSGAGDMSCLGNDSIALVVTSPPYPMIEMWDEVFAGQSGQVRDALEGCRSRDAFEAMHRVLDEVWRECGRVIVPGGFLCVNIGDAVRTIGGNFRLYTNHSRITQICESIGFESLPPVIWRKPSNAPNKFMGSGMLPSGAYVTLEHEYILIFRKGGKKQFTETEKQRRRESALFWEERNLWFSDLWDFKGIRQTLNKPGQAPAKEKTSGRQRSAAFPFELAWRLVNMYSLAGDTVLDPFLGTGTTTLAAMAAARNSVGFEIDAGIISREDFLTPDIPAKLNTHIHARLAGHIEFIRNYEAKKGAVKYTNKYGGFGVVTAQEKELRLWQIDRLEPEENGVKVFHTPLTAPALHEGNVPLPADS